MKRGLQGFVALAALISWPGAIPRAAAGNSPFTEEERARAVGALRQESIARKQEAVAMARARGWAIRGRTPAGRLFELMELRDGKPLYYITRNVNAAISTAANLIRNTAPYNVTGTNLIVGIWDGGGVRTNHQEFTPPARVFIQDGAAVDDHATHVGGTIGAKGQTATALGMAPSVTIHSYEWTSDTSEMTSRAATGPNQTNNIYVSNHSYGYLSGWEYGTYSGNTGYHWFGDYLADREDRNFGLYNTYARDWDLLCYSAPYYLPFNSAGNDRNDGLPSEGETFYYYTSSWTSKTFSAATDPYADGYDQGGYDTIGYMSVSKNILTVGAVNDAVSGGVRSLANATMADFSCWGPADDGRIKPDIVANGVGLYSSTAGGTNTYASYSGTSMSSPNAAGSALLLIEYYRSLFPTQDMRAATLKGLLIHTADDLGTAGPDYANGWGLMNCKAAADHIKKHYDQPGARFMIEDALSSTNATKTYSFVWDGSNAIRATLCWTDPAGKALTGLDNTNRALVNDLDLRVIGPGGSPTSFPYVLNRASPTNAATTGDNNVDNVEQVYIAGPGAAGAWTLRVSHKGTLTNAQQAFSVLLSGTTSDPVPVLTTLAVSNLTPTSAMSGGNITSDGGAPVTQRGLCWSTNSAPTTNDNRTSDGSGIGSYSSALTGLTPGQAYYARAYAVNSNGVGYGNEVGFSALCFTNAPGGLAASSVTDKSFTASWSALDGATGYRLDVSTSVTFGVMGGLVLINEDFVSFEDWTDVGTTADTDPTHYGAASPCRALGIGDTLTSPAVDYPTQMTFYVDASNPGNNKVTTNYYSLDGGVSWLPLGPFTVTTAGSTKTNVLTSSPNLSGSTNVKFRFVSAFNTWYLDDVRVTGGGLVICLPGYADRPINGLSEPVTNLTAETTYHFRVRAVSGAGCVSGNSATQSVTTCASLPAYYTDWANGYGMDPYGPNGSMADDYDEDGTPNLDEYTAGTDPTDDQSRFAIADQKRQAESEYLVMISAITGRVYSLYYKTNLTDGLPWSLFGAWTNLPAGPSTLILTNPVDVQLYRLGVRLP